MPLTTDQKTYLNNERSAVQASFNKYKHLKSHMGVYFDSTNNRPYVTFSNADDFRQPSIKFAGKTYNYCCTFVSASDFNTQCDAFLA